MTSQLAGRALGGLFGAVGRLRPARKPLHPRGVVLHAVLARHGLSEPIGVIWLDQPGTDEVTVRLSRAIGLPPALPDVLGLAVRIPTGPDRWGDLLFASTGLGGVSRFVLVPRRAVGRSSYSTLLPYRTPRGPLVLACTPVDGDAGELAFELRLALGRQPWQTFGRLTVPNAQAGHDAHVSFDPLINTVPGLEPYRWVTQLRERAYRAARRSRGEP